MPPSFTLQYHKRQNDNMSFLAGSQPASVLLRNVLPLLFLAPDPSSLLESTDFSEPFTFLYMPPSPCLTPKIKVLIGRSL